MRRSNLCVKASNTGTDDRFGEVIALSADGSTLAVGAFGEDAPTTDPLLSPSGAGAVHVFRRGVTGWAHEARFQANQVEDGDRFGAALDLSSDGETLAVGAPFENSAAIGVGGDDASNAATLAGVCTCLLAPTGIG